MKIGLLVIGSEVLNGKITDSNTRALADFLRLHNLEIFESMTVRDDEESIHRALTLLFKDCDVLVTSGGLGPTRDDITKETLAKFLGRNIRYSEEAEKVATLQYRRFNRPFPGKDHGYCYLPEGFTALNNPTGFAPNLFTRNGEKLLICGPGVPREFKSMLEEHFLRLADEKLDKSSFREVVLVRTKKIPEEKIFGEVDPKLWDKLSDFGDVSSLPILFGVDIGVKIEARSLSELQAKRESVLKVFEESPVKSAIWNVGYESLEEIIVKKANEKKVTFGFAESCTGGLCANRITNVSGSSKSFMGGVVCYDERVKMGLLDVKEETLKNFSAESLETAREMAQGLAHRLNVDIAISITGIAGPTGGTPEKPVGTVFIAKSVKGQTEAFHHSFYGDRELLKNRFSQAALHLLYEELEKFA